MTSSEIRYLYDKNGNLLIEKNNNEIDKIYLYGNGIEGYFVPDEENNATFYSFVKNAHEDVVKVKCQTTVLAEYDYDAFGDTVKCEETDISNSVRYAGYYYDYEIDKYYLVNRYYNGATGRFMTEDPYWNVNNMLYGNATNSVIRNVYYPAVVQSGNRFGYCGNKPIIYIDPYGTDCILVTTEDAVGSTLNSPDGDIPIYAGHTSVIAQDDSGKWYYYYWSNVSAYVIDVPDEAMESLDTFNTWLQNELATNDKIKTDGKDIDHYTTATYIEGDFSETVKYYKDISKNAVSEYTITIHSPFGKGESYSYTFTINHAYNLINNNCVTTSIDGLKKGTLENGKSFASIYAEEDFIPNKYKKYISQAVGNSSFTKPQ